MRYLILILLLPLAVLADAPSEGQLLPNYLYLSNHYPADGATGVPVDTTIWFKVFAAGADSDSLAPSDWPSACYWMTSIAGDLDTVQQLDTMSADRWSFDVVNIDSNLDCVIVVPVTSFKNYAKIWVCIFGEPTLSNSDSFYFMTEGLSKSPVVMQSASNTMIDTTATGNKVITLYRAAGATVYGTLDNSTVFTVASPSTDYATEWTTLWSTYTLTGVPQGNTRVYFWSVTPEGAVSDTVSQLFYYRRYNTRTSPDLRTWYYR